MGLSYFNKYSENFNESSESRNSPVEVWKDILTYSSSLHGNWLLSKHIFYNYILPTAKKDPVKFAGWIREMVKKSGTKIKSRSEFIAAINSLRRTKGKNDNTTEIKKALYYLLNSGLEEPSYASKALNNSA